MLSSRPVCSATLVRRGLAAAATQVKESTAPASRPLGNQEVKVSRISNGLTVVSLDQQGPLARLALAFRAGSRYELPEELGIGHRLRNCVGLGTHHLFSEQLLSQSGYSGSSLSSFTSRDLFVVRTSVLRDFANVALPVLGECAAQPAFKQWELHDTIDDINYQLVGYRNDADAQLFEMLHRAAYRNGALANSVHTPEYMVGKHKRAMLEQFARSRLLSGEAALVGINVNHEMLLSYATDYINITNGQALPPKPSPYKGGEVRLTRPGNLSHVAIVGKGAGVADAAGTAAQAVAAAWAGVGPRVAWSGRSNGVGVLALAAGESTPFGLSALCVQHADGGLFGFQMVANGNQIEAPLKAAVAAFKKMGASPPSATDLSRAKNVAKAELWDRSLDGRSLSGDFAAQALAIPAAADVTTPAELVALIERVTAADVQKAVKTAVDGGLSMAAFGKVHATPYLDEM